MADKTVTDVSKEYAESPFQPVADLDIQQIKRRAHPLKTGKLEKDVDALLRTQGFSLDETLTAPKKRGKPRGRRLRK